MMILSLAYRLMYGGNQQLIIIR